MTVVESETSFLNTARSTISEREQLLRESLGIHDVWAWEYSLDDNTLELSDETWTLFDHRENVFFEFLSIIRPEDRFRISVGILRAIRCRRGFINEALTNRYKTLAEMKIQIQGNVVETPDGLKFRGMIQNISQLRTSSKATHDDRFRTLFQLSAVGIVYGDLEGNIIDVNDKFASMTGYSRKSIVGSSIFRFTHPSDYQLTRDEQKKIFGNLTNQAFLEKRYVHKDGHSFWVQVSISAVDSSAGRPRCFLALVQDIDERVKAQTAIRQSEENFRLLAESLPQIVWVQDNNGSVYYLNEQWTDYTGRSIEESLGMRWLESIHPSDRKDIFSNMTDELLDHEMELPWREVVQRLRMVDGTYRWFLSRGVPVRDEKGEVIRWLGTSTDIDTQKKIEQELDEARMHAISASESKSAFLANMSHEIRTPLSIILGYCELLKRPGISHEMQKEFLSAMTRNGKELSQLINSILDLSKLEAEKMELALAPVELEVEIEAIIQSLRIKAEEKSLSIYLDYAPGVPKNVITDEVRLRQILINIIGNAIKFTDHSQIAVTVHRLEGEKLLAIDVIDSGCGMEEHQIERLFKAFSQVDATSTRRHGGTGLGLMLSRLLAQALGGNVVLYWTEPGVGSCFRFTINPHSSMLRAENKAEPKETSPINPQEGVLSGLKILVAEDALDNQYIFTSFLKSEGAEVEVVDNGQEAVTEGLRHDYDIILMDIQMPVMDGYDATRHLRAAGYSGPILALSAHALAEDSSKSKLAGCDDHVSKPVDFDRLIRIILQYTKEKKV